MIDSHQLQAEREVWEAVAAGTPAHSENRHLYREMLARYAGSCDGCGGRIRRGAHIFYSSLAPRGHKVFCGACGTARELSKS
jgi:hypothetical protein